MLRFVVAALALIGLVAASGIRADEIKYQSERNGHWLREGIRQFERTRNDSGVLDFDQAMLAAGVSTYVMGVLDMEQPLVLKADVVAMVVASAKRPETKLPEAQVREMVADRGYYAPLSKTDFRDRKISSDQIMTIVKNYLDQHPEKWDKHANDLVEAAVLSALSTSSQ